MGNWYEWVMSNPIQNAFISGMVLGAIGMILWTLLSGKKK